MEKKTVLFDGENVLAYVESGDPHGPPVLIQHGLIASIEDQHIFYRLAESGARLISIARPGYGDSSPYIMKNIGEWGEIAAALVEALGLAQFDVFGISSGAPYSYAIAHRFPGRARNVFILSGTPALYAENVQARWPYPVSKGAGLAEMQALADDLFFARLSEAERQAPAARDSLRHGCLGVAQDLKIRCLDWGFRLEDVRARVWMRHSRADESVPLVTAEMTARLLPNCTLEVRENDPHFSQEVLDDFISTVIAPALAPG